MVLWWKRRQEEWVGGGGSLYILAERLTSLRVAGANERERAGNRQCVRKK